ncbi:MAG TPA: hypothetical protein VD905_18265 [Flavobacteriales bacterium]|nr:hypothetical protein [Flavobacteriales bacterium]
MKVLKHSLLFIAYAGALVSNAQEIEASFSKKKILIGEQVKLTFAFNNITGNITWPVLKDTINAHIEIIDSVIKPAKDKVPLVKEYIITSFDSGYYAIPPFKFLVDSLMVETNPLLLEVHTVAVDTTKEFKDIKEIKAENYSVSEKVKDFFQWLLEHWYIPAGMLLLVIAAVWWWRKSRKKEVVPAEPAVVLPLHEQLLLDLDALDKKQLWQNGQAKQYYVELTDLLRVYIEKRFEVAALEQTTDQLTKNLKSSGISYEALEILRSILQMADMVKFAKLIPGQYENQGALDNAKRFAALTRKIEEVVNE